MMSDYLTRRIKAFDYIVEYLITKGITDVFGYPGGMVTQLMDSFFHYSEHISAHVTYHEQAAAFAACGYAQTKGLPGIAYATSGLGATNLITGIANAYFDSIPTIFITGQVNSNEGKGEYGVRQRGFQETDIVSIVKPVTKYAVYVEKAEDIPSELEKAFHISMSGRRGPVLLDIPMNLFRTEINVKMLPEGEKRGKTQNETANISNIVKQVLSESKAPVILFGAGVKSARVEDRIKDAVKRLHIPAISSMIAFDVMKDNPLYYGFLGAYGTRTANFIAAKSDLVITIGSRLDIRQVGYNRTAFAPNARILRVDVDKGELEYRVHQDEIQICTNLEEIANALEMVEGKDFSTWNAICDEIRNLVSCVDDNQIGRTIEDISMSIPDGVTITTDVGQNQVWVAQSFKVKPYQIVLFSGGHGAMGYSLPAAIGAYYGSGRKPVYCITGDGSLQMNIRELQFIAREQIPIKIVVLNNNALGMIRHFQEMYFDSRFFQTKPEGGFTSLDFSKVAEAYGKQSRCIEADDIADEKSNTWSDGPELIEVMIRENTYVVPKLELGKPNQDQEPLLDRTLYERIMSMQTDDQKVHGGYWLSSIFFCLLPSVREKERRWTA